MKAYTNSKTPKHIRDSLQTPQYIFNWARSLVGRIDFDTACTASNSLAQPIWCRDPVELGDWQGDALECIWSGVCWCNPPYSNPFPWIEHAIKQPAITLMLIGSPNGEEYYEKLIAASHEINIIGRLSFLSPEDFVVRDDAGNAIKSVKKGDPMSGNNRGSSLFIINGYGQGSRSVVRRDDLIKRFGG